MAEEKITPSNIEPVFADDMIVLNALLRTVKGINGVSSAPVFEPTPDNY